MMAPEIVKESNNQYAHKCSLQSDVLHPTVAVGKTTNRWNGSNTISFRARGHSMWFLRMLVRYGGQFRKAASS